MASHTVAPPTAKTAPQPSGAGGQQSSTTTATAKAGLGSKGAAASLRVLNHEQGKQLVSPKGGNLNRKPGQSQAVQSKDTQAGVAVGPDGVQIDASRESRTATVAEATQTREVKADGSKTSTDTQRGATTSDTAVKVQGSKDKVAAGYQNDKSNTAFQQKKHTEASNGTTTDSTVTAGQTTSKTAAGAQVSSKGVALTAEKSGTSTAMSGDFHAENPNGALVDAQGVAAKVEGEIAGTVKFDKKNASADVKAGGKATLVAGTLHADSPRLPITIGNETLNAQAHVDVAGEVSAGADLKGHLQAVKGGKVSPKLEAGARAFIGASASVEVGADLAWQKRDPAVYAQGAMAFVRSYVGPQMAEPWGSKIGHVMDFAAQAGVLDQIAAVILGTAGEPSIASVSVGVEGHAGAGVEAKGRAGMRNGMVEVSGKVGAAVGVGASASAKIGVNPLDAARLVLVLMSQGDAMAAQAHDFVMEHLTPAIQRTAEWLNAFAASKAKELGNYLAKVSPQDAAELNAWQQKAGESWQKAREKGVSVEGAKALGHAAVDELGALKNGADIAGAAVADQAGKAAHAVGNGVSAGLRWMKDRV